MSNLPREMEWAFENGWLFELVNEIQKFPKGTAENLYSKYGGDKPVPMRSMHYYRMITGRAAKLYKRMLDGGATEQELYLARKNLLVCIDSEKHRLDYEAFRKDNGIEELEKKYPKETKPNEHD